MVVIKKIRIEEYIYILKHSGNLPPLKGSLSKEHIDQTGKTV